MTTLTLSYKTIGHKIKAAHFPVLRWKPLLWAAVLLFLVTLVAYIVLVNQLTRGAFLIKDYNKQMDKLVTENKKLETSFAESGFLGNVQQQAAELNFQKTTNVAYVQILDNSVGMAK